jgi:hypothetical protein
LASKIALVALGVTALTGAGTFSLWTLRGRAPSTVIAPAQTSLPRPPETVEPVGTAEGALTPHKVAPIDNVRGERAKKTSKHPTVLATANPSPAATLVGPSDVEPELRVMREAREDLRAGRSESAYRRLDEYGRQHRGGMLAQERNALAAIAFCQWQPGPEAQRRAADFLQTSPASPLASRVRSACEKARQ